MSRLLQEQTYWPTSYLNVSTVLLAVSSCIKVSETMDLACASDSLQSLGSWGRGERGAGGVVGWGGSGEKDESLGAKV
ncbi:hypothetical protein LIER_10200 [Lithospermum erythrorhizon]|uniref:Uncharacterized protein n=1 Tax=Lithospermum erythrorhizon TaxID=34254 RepID=A0AAV3PLA9_LITER